MAELWGNEGHPLSWCRLKDVSENDLVNMVCEIACNQHDSGAVLVLVHPSNFFARIEGLPALKDGVQTITVTDVRYAGSLRLPTFVVTDATVIKQHVRVEHRDFFNLTELCCGMGVATQGFQRIGMRTVLACDANEKFVAAFRHFHPEVTTVIGDLNNQSTIRALVSSSDRPSVAFAGFSCQPYSNGGPKQGAEDSRSLSLPGVLEICYLLRCPAVILECVPDAASNKFVRSALTNFCRQCQYHMNEVQLQQEHVWPNKRDRWWVILTASSLGPLSIRPFPISPYPKCIKQILPQCWDMPAEEMDELKLSPSEHAKFLQFRPDLSTMLLNARGTCPTILHSCGSQVLPCVCSCRQSSFSDQTLSSRGVYGILMPAPGITMIDQQAVVAMRHPHPSEISILTGCLIPKSWPPCLRLALAGLGQQATPCQALWIGSQLLAHVDSIIGGSTKISPCSNLDAFLTMLLQQTKDCFATMPRPPIVAYDAMPPLIEPVTSSLVPIDPHESHEVECPSQDCPEVEVARIDWIHHGNPQSFSIVSSPEFRPLVVNLSNPDVTVGNLVAAEIGMLPTTCLVDIVDPSTGIVLPHETKLAGLCVLVCFSTDDDMIEFGFMQDQDGYASPSGASDDLSLTLPFTVQEMEDVQHPEDNCLDSSPVKKKLCSLRVGLSPEKQITDPVNDEPVADISKHEPLVVDPLANLTTQQLLALAPPEVSSLPILRSMIKPTMTVTDRCAVLESQSTAWADDEIRWHIDLIIAKSNRPGAVMLDPFVAAECMAGRGDKLLHDWLLELPEKPKIILSAVCANQHWTPFAWTSASDCLQANSWDLPASGLISKTFNHLHDKLSKALGCRTFLTRVLHRSIAAAEGCGICTIRYLDYFMRAKMLPTTDAEVEQLHHDGKEMFRSHLESSHVVPRPWTWGFGLDPQVADRFNLLLEQHGVPKESCAQRAFLVLQALGVQAVQSALIGTAPWRTLKSLSNQLRPPLQLVLPDELQSHLQSKVSQKGEGKGEGKRKQKGPKKSFSQPAKPAPLDPSKLKFDDGAFVADNGAALQQINASQLGPLIEGVAITTLGAVDQFLRNGSVVSKGHLAAFVLNADETHMTTKLPWVLSRVALRCIANNEPMLIQGFLIQLGAKYVQQGKAKHEIDVDDVGAACVKLALYRDGVNCPWDEIVAGPVKYLFKILDMLVPCTGHEDENSCGRWHVSPETPIRDPVFDVWRRQWLNLSMQVCAPSQASVFIVNVRYAKCLEGRLLARSGDCGIFMEPRSLDSKLAIMDYQVIWLPKKSLPEVLHIRQTNPCITGLARLGSRLGVRVKVADAPSLAQILRPDSIMLASGPRMDFELGPLPYGLDRCGVATLCKSWGWIAKPVNPTRSVVGDLGTVWMVQSCSEPPSAVFALKGNDVVVTKLPSKQHSVPSPLQPTVASPATLSLCALDIQESKRGPDPWLKADPWGYDASKAAAGNHSQPEVALNLQQIEDRIEQSLLAKLPKASTAMDVDQTSISSDSTAAVVQHDARLNALESQVNRLLSGHQILEQRVDEGAKKTEAQLSQVQHQMSAKIEAQSSRIEDLFQCQMNRLESLLNKKARME